MKKVKFLTLNTWYGGILFDPLIDFLQKENADVLNLQEVYDGKDPSLEKRFRCLDILTKELGYSFFSFTPSFIDTSSGQDLPWGNVILSKYPLQEKETIFFKGSPDRFNLKDTSPWRFPRNIQHVQVQISKDTLLNVFNTHGIWGKDAKDNKNRLSMSKIICEQIKNKQHVILSGDFNVDQNTKTIENIEQHLINVFKNELKTTFNIKQKGTKAGFAKSVVDMVFVSKDIRVTQHSCPDVNISDHLPLMCVFEV